MTTLADRVRHAREKIGISCSAVDERAGLSTGHTAKIEAGERETPSAFTLHALAKALDVDMGWLMGDRVKRVAQ